MIARRFDRECSEDLHRMGCHGAAMAARRIAPVRYVLEVPSANLPPSTSATAKLLAQLPEVSA